MMIVKLVLLLLLSNIIYARVLPAYDDGAEKRIDDKKAAGVNQEFLSAFLGNVKDNDGSDTKDFSALNSFNEDDNKGSSYEESSYGYDGPSYSEPSYEEYGGYESSYDDDYQSSYSDKDVERMTRSYKAAINCREFHHKEADSISKCHNVKLRDYSSDFDRNDPNELAFCRWDMGFDEFEDKQAGCLCPRTKDKCNKKNQCYWYKSKHSDDGDCVHNSERFYNILANLLSKRGKKDFALKIKYSSAAAKGNLPFGPWGPAHFDLDYQPYVHRQLEHPFDHNPFMNIYDTPNGHSGTYMQPGPHPYEVGQHYPMMGYGGPHVDNRMPNSYQYVPHDAQMASHSSLSGLLPGYQTNPRVNFNGNFGIQNHGHYQSLPNINQGIGSYNPRYGNSYDAVPPANSHGYYNNVQAAPSQTSSQHPIPLPVGAANPVPATEPAIPDFDQGTLTSGYTQTPSPVHSPDYLQAAQSGFIQGPLPSNIHSPSPNVQLPNTNAPTPNPGYGNAINPGYQHNHAQAFAPLPYGY